MTKYRFSEGTVYVPEGVEEIEDEAFIFRDDITRVCLPSTVRRIGRSAFQECVNLEEINYPEALEEIDEAAFCNCLSLPTPSLADTMRIGALAFHHTKGTVDPTQKGENNL